MIRKKSYASVAIGVLITVFWLGMMFSLVRDKVFPQRRAQALAAQAVDPSTLTSEWSDFEETMAVNYNGQDIGAVHTRVFREPGGLQGYVATLRFGINLQLLGAVHQIETTAKAELNSGLELDRFHIRANFGSLQWTLTGLLTSEELFIELNEGKKISRTKLALDRRISFIEAVRPAAARNLKLEPGNSVTVPVIDPVWSMQRGAMQIVVADRETIRIRNREHDAFRIETRLNEFVTTSWVDADGRTLRRELTQGLTLEQTSPRHAQRLLGREQKPVEIPRLDPEDFAGVPTQPIDAISDKEIAPLQLLGRFFKPL